MVALLGVVAFGVATSFGDGGASPPIVDFDAFRIAGDLARQGRLAEAYDWPTMKALEETLGRSRTGFLPYAYPPVFGIALAGLSWLPIGAAYASFVACGFAAFASALHRLSPLRFWPTMLALGPVLLVNVRGGQNGMLTAGMAGLAVAAGLDGRRGAAGTLAGALVAFKPQIAVGPPLAFLLARHWRTLAVAALVAATASVVAVAVLGSDIVPAFLGALSATGQGLSAGRFPLNRMISVYACLRSLGVPAAGALSAHAAAAFAVLAAVLRVGRRLEPRAAAGLSLMATAFVSPYVYDYDLTVVGLGLAVALPPTYPPLRAAALLTGLALAGSFGAVEAIAFETRLSAGAPLLALVLACSIAGLRSEAAQRVH